MSKVIQCREVEPAVRDSSGEMSSPLTMAANEYRDAVACLYGIIKLSPRIAHRITRKIIRIYRHLSLISEGRLNDF